MTIASPCRIFSLVIRRFFGFTMPIADPASTTVPGTTTPLRVGVSPPPQAQRAMSQPLFWPSMRSYACALSSTQCALSTAPLDDLVSERADVEVCGACSFLRLAFEEVVGVVVHSDAGVGHAHGRLLGRSVF